MKARIRKLFNDLGETFWVVPGLAVAAGILLALGLVHVDRTDSLTDGLRKTWLYDGGGTGARTLLGAIASSAIGVAGTVFSITIAALSLAAGQMGPRLLRNFTRDRGNQLTLGIFLGTFAYALMVLRSIRTQDEGEFVPHLALSAGLFLAMICVATLVYFVAHIASRINVDTVIDLVGEDLRAAIQRLTTKEPQPEAPDASIWSDGQVVCDPRRGYLQELDTDGLADWAAERDAQILLLVRPGDHVFPGSPIAVVTPETEGAQEAVRAATALGSKRMSSADLEFAVRQLVEVAVRALSPGINDPYTALSVLDRLGAALCDIGPFHLRSGVVMRQGKPVLVVRNVDYDGLADSMFHLIRQNARGSATVLVRQLEVLAAIASCETAPHRLATLSRHAGLVLADAERSVSNADDLDDVRNRYRRFIRTRRGEVLAASGRVDPHAP
ncbi:DUF2254 domain-containing protein [Aquabacter spiritensis]|uniref:Putative membrane protein n=1 Tax=Aquabacter spiritensis TaxID=933073 RepID=A0A4R3LTX8_9HYPH|nr:DUF2254 domain-containing protein [Aquabacter spiritensis]TCT03993.1 putative membrane protein [Aquabacter spiritensis]